MRPWALHMLGEPPVRLVVHPGHVFRIGRDTEADLCLDDRLVSRRHIDLTITESGALEATDLGSRNGTKLNGRPLKGKVALNPGDELKIGSAILVIDGVAAGSSAPARPRAFVRAGAGGIELVEPSSAPPAPDGPPSASPQPKAPVRSTSDALPIFLEEAGASSGPVSPVASLALPPALERVSTGPGASSRSPAVAPHPSPQPAPPPPPPTPPAPRPPASRDPFASPDPRAQIPGYELLSQVARGRTGVIWRARSTLPGGGERLVKVLDPAAASRESALERFEAEASAIARIDHPNIVRLIDVSNANGLYFYVMEPVEGRTLEEHLTEGTLEPRDAIVICAQVARGLAVAHAQSVVHRDVAPASVIVTGEMVTKLFDFAFLKVQEEVPSLTDVGDVVGDYRFCAPEQAANPRSIDARADLYSVGAMLYYSLAGRPPIEGRSFLDTYKRLISEPPQPLQELVPDVRPKLAQVVARTLEKEPEKRYASGAELAAALDEALLDTLVAARTFAPPPGAGIGADFRGLELLEVLQVLAARHATGHLAVTSTTGDGLEGELLLRGGDVAAAKTTLTEAARAASAQLLDVRAGNFTFRSAPSVADRGESPLSAAQLALDALRRRR